MTKRDDHASGTVIVNDTSASENSIPLPGRTSPMGDVSRRSPTADVAPPPAIAPMPYASTPSGIGSEDTSMPSNAQAAAVETGMESTSMTPNGQPPAASPVRSSPSSASGSRPGSGSNSGSREYTGQAHPAAPPADPEPGARLHHYEIIKLLGRGGMGSVFLGRDTRLGRRVAIKFLRTHSAELTKRFILEARMTAACSHENIVVIYEVDAWQGSPFMVFEYLQGQTLTKFIPDNKPLPVPRAVELIVPVVRALAYAHTQGIVHRDLKPDNILITDSGLTKVLDFGIAKVLQGDEKAGEQAARPRAPKTSLEDEDDSELTHAGAMMGTLAYMAPEQWGIGVPIDHRADIWAVGIMLYKMLAGRHPLHPLTGHQLMVTGILTELMPSLSSGAPDAPKELIAAVDRCLMKHKDERWPDAVSLLRALEPFLPGRYSKEIKIDESPYAGLSSFQETDADRFFGRRHEIAAVVNRLRERPLLGIVGPSGAGKSSFVRAGLVPALKRSGEGWESLVLRPGRSPLAALAALISPMVATSASVADDLAEQKKLAQRLASEPGYAGAILRARARREKKNLLVFVDQFEELYTLVPDLQERQAFTACLAGIADDATTPLRVVLSVRSDFLDRVPEDARFMSELSQGLVFLNAPGVEGLRDAIVQPAELAGYKFETPTIVEDMLSHLQTTPGALPLLQFAATKLWENRDPARKLLTKIGYEAIGGVTGALASHADAVLAKIPPQSVPLVRSIVMRLVTPDRTRAIVSLDELKDLSKNEAEVRSLVDELVNARLLVIQTGAGSATVELVHESLIHSWPALKRWLEETGEDSAFLEELRIAAKQWVQKNRGADLLWRGELAEEAMRFQRRYSGVLPETQREFLQATIALAARGARVRRRLLIAAMGFLGALLVAAGVALLVIRDERSRAEDQREIAVRSQEEAVMRAKEATSAMTKAQESETKARKANEELTKKQKELFDALRAAEDARKDAEAAQQKAVHSAAEAISQKKQTEAAKKRAEDAYRRAETLRHEQEERAKKLEQQLGSPVIDELK